jgi:hypothetical protein
LAYLLLDTGVICESLAFLTSKTLAKTFETSSKTTVPCYIMVEGEEEDVEQEELSSCSL